MTSLYLGKIKKQEKIAILAKNNIIKRFNLFDFLSDSMIPIIDVMLSIKIGK